MSTSRQPAERRRALARLLRTSGPGWLLQCNPRNNGVLDDLARGHLPQRWCVKAHVGEIRPGDRALFWISGARAGVYAAGEVASLPQSDPPVVGDGFDEVRAGRFVLLDLYVDLSAAPIGRRELTADPRWAAESILRRPFAANPHRVSAAAFDVILDELSDDPEGRVQHVEPET